MLTHQAKNKRRRNLKINKNLLNKARKLKSKNQGQVKLQNQVMMKSSDDEEEEEFKQVVAPRMIVKKSSKLLKESTKYSRSTTQRVFLQPVNNW
jgi:hypothetical protein